MAALDESFFRVRFDRLTPKEKRYLRAMSELGPGPHRSGDIATCYPAKVTSLAPTRSSLIAKGMIWSPNHGDTDYTVPMFDAFMKRIMPVPIIETFLIERADKFITDHTIGAHDKGLWHAINTPIDGSASSGIHANGLMGFNT